MIEIKEIIITLPEWSSVVMVITFTYIMLKNDKKGLKKTMRFFKDLF